MKREDEFDEMLRSTLRGSTSGLTLSPDIKKRIDNGILDGKARAGAKQTRKEREDYIMKRWSVRKVLIVAAVICLAGSTVVMAAGRYKSSVAVVSAESEITSYEELMAQTEEKGFTDRLPESFGNGYTFKEGSFGETWGESENGEKSASMPFLSLDYQKEGMPRLSVSVDQSSAADLAAQEGSAAREEIAAQSENGDVTLYYTNQIYKIVPEGYEMTEQDKADESEGRVVFSYGSDSLEETSVKGLSFHYDGYTYVFMSMDSPMEKDDFVNMAEEIIAQ